MPDVFTKSKRSEVMSRAREQGHGTCAGKTFSGASDYRLATQSGIVRKSRFRFSETETRYLGGRLFLARLPEALQPAGEQSRVLAANKARDALVTRTLKRGGWRGVACVGARACEEE